MTKPVHKVPKGTPTNTATRAQIAQARDRYTNRFSEGRDIKIDDDAMTDEIADGSGVWIHAWVWLENK